MPTDFDLDFLIALAQEAGEIARRWFRHTTVEMKGDATPVTQADREVEAFLTAELRRAYPDYGILGEEGADLDEHARFRWVLDPIDGTNAFAAGLPVWGISIGLMEGIKPLAGVVYLPAVNDLFAVGLEGPAMLNGRPIRVIEDGPITPQSIIMSAADGHLRWDIRFPGKVRAFGSCTAHFCYVAAGSALAGLNTHTAIWDIAAALPILERAGGRAELFGGGPLPMESAARGEKIPEPILFGSPAYFDAIRRYLRPKVTRDA